MFNAPRQIYEKYCGILAGMFMGFPQNIHK